MVWDIFDKSQRSPELDVFAISIKNSGSNVWNIESEAMIEGKIDVH